MHFSALPWQTSLFVPVTIHTENFFAHSSLRDDKKFQIETFNDSSKLMSGIIDIDSFEISTFINGIVNKFRPFNHHLSVTFDCPMDGESTNDCIRASVEWVSCEDKNYKVKIMTEIPIVEIINRVALGLHQLQEKHWTNCFALNKLKAVHLIFDRVLKKRQKVGEFKIEPIKGLEIEPLHPLPKIKRGEKKLNPNLILSSLMNATYMQKHPQESLYVRTCYQETTPSSNLDLKNRSVIKHPNGAKVTRYL